MKQILAVLAVVCGALLASSGARVEASTPQSAAFTVKCGQYNYCTFTSKAGNSGTWEFSDWKFLGGQPVAGVSYERPLSTHDPINGTTPYTTTVVFTVGSSADTGYVRCSMPWNVKGMCRQVQKP